MRFLKHSVVALVFTSTQAYGLNHWLGLVSPEKLAGQTECVSLAQDLAKSFQTASSVESAKGHCDAYEGMHGVILSFDSNEFQRLTQLGVYFEKTAGYIRSQIVTENRERVITIWDEGFKLATETYQVAVPVWTSVESPFESVEDCRLFVARDDFWIPQNGEIFPENHKLWARSCVRSPSDGEIEFVYFVAQPTVLETK